jgi:glyoxylase-like metal-dependent hydrolase (beta-lactamase superfamily II)
MIHTLDLHFLGQSKVIASFLIDCGNNTLALVESGPHSTFERLKQEVKRLGFAIENIQHVFLTHIHLDHAGAAWALAAQGARIYVHPFGAPHLIDPSRLMDSAKRIYLDLMDKLWGQMEAIPEALVIAVDEHESFTIGNKKFVAHYTPGHAIHHIAWQLGDALFTGDVAGVKIEAGMVEPPCPPPDIHLEDWLASIELMQRLPVSKLYLTHFGLVEDKKTHLQALQTVLLDWAHWIKPHYEAQRAVADVVPEFQAYVEAQLKAQGVSDTGIAQYEAANPAYMSVSGLMRYWKKKEQEA